MSVSTAKALRVLGELPDTFTINHVRARANGDQWLIADYLEREMLTRKVLGTTMATWEKVK